MAKSCQTLCNHMDCCSTPGFPVLHHVPEFVQTYVCWVTDAIQPPYPPLLPPLLPSISPSIKVCSNESALPIRWPKFWNFSFSISPSNQYSRLIDFLWDWLVWSPCCPRASVLQHSAFFMVQLSHLYRTTGKTIALTLQTFVGKVTSLLFTTLSRLVIAFLPRSKPTTNSHIGLKL